MKGSDWRKVYCLSRSSFFPTLLASSNPPICCERRVVSYRAYPHPRDAKYPATTNGTTQFHTVKPRAVTQTSRSSDQSPQDYTPKYRPALNPPPSTRPPVLILPVKTNTSPIYKYYFNLGKAYLAFYKNGLKGIYLNYKIARGLSHASFHPLFVSRRTLYAGAMTKKLSRADLRLLIRLRADTKVLPLFILVFICCGEFTPLLVPWLTVIVPPSLHIPLQTQALQRKAEKMRQQARLEGPLEWRSIRTIWDIKPAQVHDMTNRAIIRRLAIELGLYPQWWGKMPGIFEAFLIERRLIERLRDLQYDDLTIVRDGGVKDMISEEVALACQRRGLNVEGKEDQSLRRLLEEWLRGRNGDSAQGLVKWVRGQK